MNASKHKSFGIYTLITLIIPMVGFILGIVYMTKDKQEDKNLGVWLLVMSILFFIGWLFFWSILGAMSYPETYPAY